MCTTSGKWRACTRSGPRRCRACTPFTRSRCARARGAGPRRGACQSWRARPRASACGGCGCLLPSYSLRAPPRVLPEAPPPHRRRIARPPCAQCNPEPGLLAMLDALGCGFDCASVQELEAAAALGVPQDRIIFANPMKVRCPPPWGLCRRRGGGRRRAPLLRGLPRCVRVHLHAPPIGPVSAALILDPLPPAAPPSGPPTCASPRSVASRRPRLTTRASCTRLRRVGGAEPRGGEAGSGAGGRTPPAPSGARGPLWSCRCVGACGSGCWPFVPSQQPLPPGSPPAP